MVAYTFFFPALCRAETLPVMQISYSTNRGLSKNRGFHTSFATPPACYRSLSGPSGGRSVPGVSLGVSVSLRPFGPRAPECLNSFPSVPGVFGTPFWHSGDTLGTLFGHSGAQGPKGPRNTLRDTPGTLRARRARETTVAGRGGCNTSCLVRHFISDLLTPSARSTCTRRKTRCLPGGHPLPLTYKQP